MSNNQVLWLVFSVLAVIHFLVQSFVFKLHNHARPRVHAMRAYLLQYKTELDIFQHIYLLNILFIHIQPLREVKSVLILLIKPSSSGSFQCDPCSKIW